MSPPPLWPRPGAGIRVTATVVGTGYWIAFVLVLLGALEHLEQLVRAAFDYAAPPCPRTARREAAELAACCCEVSEVVFGDAFQDSSSRKYCEIVLVCKM